MSTDFEKSAHSFSHSFWTSRVGEKEVDADWTLRGVEKEVDADWTLRGVEKEGDADAAAAYVSDDNDDSVSLRRMSCSAGSVSPPTFVEETEFPWRWRWLRPRHRFRPRPDRPRPGFGALLAHRLLLRCCSSFDIAFRLDEALRM
jgi:hypothetical protein